MSGNVTVFLKQFPHWQDYATGLARPIGTPEAESQAVRDAAAALSSIEEASPGIIAPDAQQPLQELQHVAMNDNVVNGHNIVHPLARRSYLRAVCSALRSLFADTLSSSREGFRSGLKTYVAGATVVALAAATPYLFGLARALPSEFGWLSRFVAYIQILL